MPSDYDPIRHAVVARAVAEELQSDARRLRKEARRLRAEREAARREARRLLSERPGRTAGGIEGPAVAPGPL